MFAIYVGELLKRVFFPTTRGADYVSVLIPLAVSATAYFAGVKVSDSTTTQILAYVGVFTVLVFVFRLLISGPYSMWRDEAGSVAALKLELSKPERAVFEHLSKHRAKARARLALALENLHSVSFTQEWNNTSETLYSKSCARVWKLEAQAGLGPSFNYGRRLFMTLVYKDAKTNNQELSRPTAADHLLKTLQSFLMGEITAEALALRLPQDIEAGKQP